MSFSQGAARNVVPLLGRLVLAAAFIPAGWSKIMESADFVGEDAEILKDLGIGDPVDAAEARSRAADTPEAVFDQVLASYQEVETGSLRDRRPSLPLPPPDENPPAGTRPDEGAGQIDPPRDEVEIPPPPPVEGEWTARRLHKTTVMLVNSPKWPEAWKPGFVAWFWAGTELVGGSAILIGLLSRLCGFGLALIMALSYYLTSNVAFAELFSLEGPEFAMVFSQIGLFVFAFGIFLTGAGGFSVDRFLFGGGGFDYGGHDDIIDLG